MSDARPWRDLAQCAVLLGALGVMPHCAEGTATERAAATATRLNRAPHPVPELPRTGAELAQFPAAFDRWFADAFGGRASLVAARSRLAVLALADSPTSTLLVGPRRWIFAREQRGLEAVRGLAPLSDAELGAWLASLSARRAWLAERGIAFAFVLAPEKAAIYPEELPARLPFRGPEDGGEGRREGALKYFSADPELVVPDVAAHMRALRAAAPETAYLYTPTGVHWRARGALAAYRALGPFLERYAPEVAPWTDEDFELVSVIDTSDSWAQRLSLGTALFTEELALRPRRAREAVRRAAARSGNELDASYERAGEGGPTRRTLVLHDSFGPELLPFLAEHFRVLEARRTIDFDLRLIEELRPDVVIQVYSEHALLAQRPDRSAALAQAALAPAFQAATDVVLALSRPGSFALHDTSGAATLSAPPDALGGFTLTIEGPTALLALPTPARPRLGERWVLGVDLTLAAADRVALFYLEPGDTAIDRKRVYVAEVPAGRQTAVFELGPRARPDGLVLGFGRSASGARLHGVEVRRIEE